MAALWLATYVFLLRMPSEALPMERGTSQTESGGQSVIYLDENETLCLKLKTRKNKMRGSLLKRTCSCKACPEMCPVHALWHGFFKKLPVGAKPWANLNATKARERLRDTLDELEVCRRRNAGMNGYMLGLCFAR